MKNYHKSSSVKSYIAHELSHLLECVLTFKLNTKNGITKENYEMYYIANQCQDVSKNIFENLYWTLDRRNILGNNAYGNKNVSEFFAEAISEYLCLEEHQQYMIDIYAEAKKLYSKLF